MIKNIKRVLKKRKAKIFFVFLGCSATIWFINALSQTYVGNAAFDLEYVNYPEGYLYKGASKKNLDVKLRAGGFQFLGFNFKNKRVEIDVSEAEKNGTRFYVPENRYRSQIEKQMTGSMALLEIEEDTLFLNLLPVVTKKLPVRPQVKINLAQNYLLDGKVGITPDSITVTGPAEEIDSLTHVRTKEVTLPDLNSDFTEELGLFKSPRLENTTYSSNQVTLSGKIARFSEKIFEVPVTVVNLPSDLEIKTFPAKIAVVTKAKMQRLKELRESDFEVVIDYKTKKSDTSEKLSVALRKKPKGLHSVKLKETEVEYIIKKK
ncbi:CdaR family protein [Pricia sp. S334]|uniref:CdaR family protein n=1 Tax=Pricia mediterranea TaxID=3076079 RepID=A0ABU3LBU7_9FLAO|nr:CdaR family protein [Pricia sp. S334]MDT7830693.1 CdaR family protein [Pricia sp. S334]